MAGFQQVEHLAFQVRAVMGIQAFFPKTDNDNITEIFNLQIHL